MMKCNELITIRLKEKNNKKIEKHIGFLSIRTKEKLSNNVCTHGKKT